MPAKTRLTIQKNRRKVMPNCINEPIWWAYVSLVVLYHLRGWRVGIVLGDVPSVVVGNHGAQVTLGLPAQEFLGAGVAGKQFCWIAWAARAGFNWQVSASHLVK